MREILDVFKQYNGTGYLVFLFLLALLYLWLTERDKRLRAILVYAPTVLLALFFLPPFKWMLDMVLDEEVYYRVLWLLPMGIVTAYAGVQLIREHLRLGVACVCLVLIFSGSYVYHNQYMHRAENLYHIPQDVVDICDAIAPEGDGQVMAAFPAELIHYVRQYDSSILMPYGRDMLVPRWDYARPPIYEVMEGTPKIDVEKLAPLLEEYGCHYVIFWNAKTLIGEPEDFGLSFVMETEEYRVYRTGVPLDQVFFNDSYLYE